ncbi:MAG: DUF1761 domain-containing protein [Patescibacteria group bacterium]
MDIYLNYWAVLVSAIANMALGMLWYSPLLFGKSWMREMGFTNESMERAKARGMGKIYAAAFVGSLVMAYVMAYFVFVWAAADFMSAFQLAFWIWLGFVATVMMSSILWEGKSAKLYFINAGYHLVSLFITALILALW